MNQDQDMITDPDMIDLKLLEGKKGQTVVIDRKVSRDHPILLDALDASVRVVSRATRL